MVNVCGKGEFTDISTMEVDHICISAIIAARVGGIVVPTKCISGLLAVTEDLLPSIHTDILITEVSTEAGDTDSVPSSRVINASSRVINVRPSFATVASLVMKVNGSSTTVAPLVVMMSVVAVCSVKI